jgi:glutamyl/glutaminyl-tRNA synthetase
MLQRLLALPTPRYRHHFLLLESHGNKLAKLHGSIPFAPLRARYTAAELCGILATAAGLGAGTPRELIARFDWARVPRDDRVARWDGALVIT